jgi:hypothetical protein
LCTILYIYNHNGDGQAWTLWHFESRHVIILY